ncbi:M17 family metallopeptidase [[Mycoplasma] gypis]|uniref:Probable cytosol aminopeptidase n=1 Tax=[Mycoplasma] gypis TaxID=92404 RepID=A0ABZ2RNC5_9BACT|nr:leucyl aminopeptidase family protein [[Mycoplasma] gypis]MBN0919340.1 leucyl aminopeptidase family protein [[Mycoplasma] gypis]
MLEIVNSIAKQSWTLEAKFYPKKNPFVDFYIREDVQKKIAYVYLPTQSTIKPEQYLNFAKSLPIIANREYIIDVASFKTSNINLEDLTKIFSYGIQYGLYKTFSLKTEQQNELLNHKLLIKKQELMPVAQKSIEIALAQNKARYYQAMAPNIANSEFLANEIVKNFAEQNIENVTVSVYDKKQIQDLKMNLFLSVNEGSNHEARLVVIDYTYDANDKNRTVLVGKGITFDAGGYQIKTKKGMPGMKYDMTGSVVAAFSVEALAKIKAKQNVSAVLLLTDNRVNAKATVPDSVFVSMNGKSVEVNNTDAEGRLVLADGLTFAIRNLKATKLIDIATLTGAIQSALGDTYCGVFATDDNFYNQMLQASKNAFELIWRMPMDEQYSLGLKKSKIADLYNSDLSGDAGSCTAAMFLNEFREDVDLIHIDIAAVAKKNNYSNVPMIPTLVEMLNGK